MLLALLAFGSNGEEQAETPKGAPPRGAAQSEATDTKETESKDAAAERTARSSIRPTEPPPAVSLHEARGPDVTLIAGEERTVYEYRQNGKLSMIKVVPKVGKPYFLVPRDPTTGFGDLEQAETLVPRWVLIEF
ncbi:MAG: DUF2782 domain-containing protein [Gammaproteobacteria bacterium]|nr:DUF2782 domain-containing protein [Gammaproteobacteria bacterium]